MLDAHDQNNSVSVLPVLAATLGAARRERRELVLADRPKSVAAKEHRRRGGSAQKSYTISAKRPDAADLDFGAIVRDIE